MSHSSRMPDDTPERCPVCGSSLRFDPSGAPGDAICPNCGSVLRSDESLLRRDPEAWVPNAVLGDLHASNKSDAIRQIVARLTALEFINTSCEEEIVRLLLGREELGSTGIGNGVAVPHAKHASVDQSVIAMAISREGIDFNSLDNQSVNVIFLLISPVDRPGEHLRALKRISRYIKTQ